LVYPTIDTVAACVARLGRGCYIYKRDLHRAYRQFLVDPRDYPLLGCTWQGHLYFDTFLPMGLCSAAMASQRITSAVCYICSEAGFTVLNYVDDFMGVEPASRAWKSYFYLEDLLSRLGLHKSISKAVPPVQKVTCLGVEVNTLDMTLSVDSSRLAALQSLLQLWLTKRMCTQKQLQSLVGHLMFVSKCVRQSLIFVSRILLRRLKAPHHHLRLTSEFKKDLHWWLRFLPLYNGVSLIPTSPWTSPDAVFSMDACLSGCGGISSTAFFHSPFSDSVLQRCSAIHHLELLVIMVAVRLWGHLWSGQHIQVFCDNEAVVTVLISGRTKDPVLAQCLREIWFSTAQAHFELRAVHLTSKDNRVADYLSRWHLSATYRDYLINNHLLEELKAEHLSPDVFDFVANL